VRDTVAQIDRYVVLVFDADTVQAGIAAHRRVRSRRVPPAIGAGKSDTGAVVAEVPIGRGTDAAAFDPVRHRVFSSNGDRTLTVIDEVTPDHFEVRATIATEKSARTMAFDPASGRVFLVAADVIHVEPPKGPGGHPHYDFAPDSVKLFVLTPTR
jgi:hypothetical protein